MEIGSGMILGLKDKDGSGESKVAWNTKGLYDHRETHGMLWWDLNEKQRRHEYKYTISHPAEPRKCHRGKNKPCRNQIYEYVLTNDRETLGRGLQ